MSNLKKTSVRNVKSSALKIRTVKKTKSLVKNSNKTLIQSTNKDVFNDYETNSLDFLSFLGVGFILMFGFYIQFYGEVSPGGGFQSGIIFAIAFIFKDAISFLSSSKHSSFVSSDVAIKFLSGGVLCYGFAGVISLLLGSNFLDYTLFAVEMSKAGERGLMMIETGVAMTVFGAMILISNSLQEFLFGESGLLRDKN